MKKLLILLFSISSICLHSQDVKFNLLMSPLCLIDEFSFPTIQPGVEMRLNQRLSIFTEFGMKFKRAFYEYRDTSFINSTGYKAKVEIRYYLKTWNNQTGTNERGLFLGLNTFYIENTFNDLLNYNKENKLEIQIADCFSVKKHVWGANVVFGWQQTIIKHIVIESFGGFGIRCRRTENNNLQFDPLVDEIVKTTDPNFDVILSTINTESGTRSLLNFTAGIRFGYQF
jgi:hypothetical protein